MRYLPVTIQDKIAVYMSSEKMICYNSDYILQFTFDAEWDSYTQKTAQIRYFSTNKGWVKHDIIFTGMECNVPVIPNANVVYVGVYAGDIRTTTEAEISCRPSVLSYDGAPVNPPDDVYNQIMQKLNEIEQSGATPEQIAAAIEQYHAENPITAEDVNAVPQNQGAENAGKFLGINEAGDVVPVESGADGITPHIGDNGNWYIGETDTGIKAQGEKGDPGDPGPEEVYILGDGETVNDAPESSKVVFDPNETGEPGGGSDISLGISGAAIGQTVKITAVDDNGVPTAWEPVDAPSGGDGTSETVTAEKIYAAAVKSLKQVGENNYIPQKDSVLFVANADGIVSVGSDNLIDYTINNFPPNEAITELLHNVTTIDKGYHFESNPNYTASDHFANSRFFLKANIVAGKTYTLSFQQSVKIYVYLLPDAESPGDSPFLITTGATTDWQSVTFTAEADYQAVRFAPFSLPADLTNVTLCEGESPLPYGGASETYDVTAGQMLYLTDVFKQNIVGNGVFYESPIAITSLNGQETSDGNMNTCTNNAVWVNMGDSIWTFGANTGGIGTISDYMKSLCGGTWHNIATGGTTMATRPGDYAGTYDSLDFWKLADAIVSGDYTDAKAAAAELTSNFSNIDNVDWSAVDYVTIAYGTNDIAFGGTIDNADNLYDMDTICGALRYGIKTISAKYPNIRFMVLAVLNRGADSVPLKTILECNDALKSAADYMGAEFVDGYGINEGNRGTFLYDGTHPNAAGKQRIAETVARRIIAVNYTE